MTFMAQGQGSLVADSQTPETELTLESRGTRKVLFAFRAFVNFDVWGIEGIRLCMLPASEARLDAGAPCDQRKAGGACAPPAVTFGFPVFSYIDMCETGSLQSLWPVELPIARTWGQDGGSA
jgi:hypothetical protein